MIPSFTVHGDAAIVRRLKALESTKKQNAVCRRGLNAGAKLMQSAVKSAAPVGETGNLKRSVKRKAGKRSRRRISRRVEVRRQPGQPFYAGSVEFGDKDQPAEHFGESAFLATKPTAAAAIRAAILADLEREA